MALPLFFASLPLSIDRLQQLSICAGTGAEIEGYVVLVPKKYTSIMGCHQINRVVVSILLTNKP
jgi:hypothetical protein